jgi:beta-lactamase regulating signal transducer with metallopeptidase domain
MSYSLRGFALFFAILFVVYGGMSVAVLLVWQSVWRFGQKFSARICSNLLFGLRMAPLFVAMVATLALAMPSFLMLEPRTPEEDTSLASLFLAACGIVVIAAGIWRVAEALWWVSETIARWATASTDVASVNLQLPGRPVSVKRTSVASPPLTTAGILKPVVWISSQTESILSGGELSCALRHEVAHVRRHDNLRKMILLLSPMAGMAELESAWREATEMAADDAAVSSESEALDLATAVIKLSQSARLQAPAELTATLVHSPAEVVDARVKRLLAWPQPQKDPEIRFLLWLYSLGTAAMLTMVVMGYSHLLVRVHTATEWLVR